MLVNPPRHNPFVVDSGTSSHPLKLLIVLMDPCGCEENCSLIGCPPQAPSAILALALVCVERGRSLQKRVIVPSKWTHNFKDFKISHHKKNLQKLGNGEIAFYILKSTN